jgi:hypothetical protein
MTDKVTVADGSKGSLDRAIFSRYKTNCLKYNKASVRREIVFTAVTDQGLVSAK